jgi:hypothetical protein
MPVEVATAISGPSGLVTTNPALADPVAQGQQHLQLIKTVLTACFPTITGPITTTLADLNSCAGLPASFATLNATAWTGPSANTGTGSLTLTGSGFVNAPSIQRNGSELVPIGTIVMWWGSVGSVPAGWALCNGQTVNGFTTPNMLDRFPIAAGLSFAPGSAGGSATLSGTTGAGGSVTPNCEPAGATSLSGTTDTQGTHSHGASTGSYTLQISDIPNHNHTQTIGQGASGPVQSWSVGAGNVSGSGLVTGYTGGGGGHAHSIGNDGSHAHNLNIGAIGSHVHAIDTLPAHTHSFSGTNLPPYGALCFIMRVS